jgi:serine/threonine protein kinase
MMENESVEDWPKACFAKYDRIQVLGTGSFGCVWMAKRLPPAVDEFDDDYVAIKSIHIKNEKSKVYAEREIRILHELRHPNVIRLVQAFDVYKDARVVVLQLARGPNLHQLVIKRGALGLPLSRLVARQLIAAVGYSTFFQECKINSRYISSLVCCHLTPCFQLIS